MHLTLYGHSRRCSWRSGSGAPLCQPARTPIRELPMRMAAIASQKRTSGQAVGQTTGRRRLSKRQAHRGPPQVSTAPTLHGGPAAGRKSAAVHVWLEAGREAGAWLLMV